MGFWRRFSGLFRAPVATFDSAPRPIDEVIGEMLHRSGPSIGRAEALSVPAVQRGRNLMCSISTLPLVQYGPGREVVRNPLLEQFDPDVPNVVHLSQTIEDLLFEGISWWRITAFAFDDYPLSVRHLDVGSVSLQPPGGRSPAPLPAGEDPRGAIVYVDGRPVTATQMIRFDSPNPAVLKVGGRAIRRALLLDKAAATYASDPRPLDYFTPAPDSDPVDDDEVKGILADWRAARRKRSTAWVPQALQYNTVDVPSPADLQLVELQKQASLDIANALGLDPEDLGVSTTSRTYQNAIDRRRDRINDVLSPFMRAVTDRLSMGDVTKRGYRVAFDLDDYLKSNPTERWATYRTAKEIGVLDAEEIREREGWPAGAPKPAPLPVAPVDEPPAEDEPTAADASVRPTRTLNAAGRRLVELPLQTFKVDAETRVIEGLALPYGKQAGKYGGIRFERGALKFADVSRVKLLREHGLAIGVALKLTESSAGFSARFKVARGAAGDEALSLAEDGVLDGLSVGVDFDDAADTVPDPRHKGGILVRRADLREVSLTATPAFDDARLTKVVASSTPEEITMQPDTEPTTAPVAPAVPAGVTLTNEQFQALLARPTAPVTPAPVAPVEPRQVVNPTRLTASVTDPAPYRFDRRGNLAPAAHEFSSDLISGLRDGDRAAYDRAMGFVSAQFDVITTDVNELNPTRSRPDMYVDQRSFRYPVWEAISKGSLSDITPFTFPKFSSAASLVAAHSEGTEPSSGTFVTTLDTVTPTALSGKAKISRETWDQGGNPQIGNLIWRQMEKGWYEALEAAAVAVLDTATPTAIDFSGTPGLANDDLDQAITAAFASLQFIRGGFSMDKLFAQVDLFKALVAATGTDGRRLYPALGPSNANGTVAGRWATLDINGVTAIPAWALAATGAVVASSYLFDSDSVHGWASAPQRMTIDQTEVANVYIGLWGYKATVISDLNGVREILYDPS